MSTMLRGGMVSRGSYMLLILFVSISVVYLHLLGMIYDRCWLSPKYTSKVLGELRRAHVIPWYNWHLLLTPHRHKSKTLSPFSWNMKFKFGERTRKSKAHGVYQPPGWSARRSEEMKTIFVSRKSSPCMLLKEFKFNKGNSKEPPNAINTNACAAYTHTHDVNLLLFYLSKWK